MDNQIENIKNLNSLDDLYNSLYENSITASHKHNWIVDGGEIDITASKFSLDKDPYLWMLTNQHLSVDQKQGVIDNLSTRIDEDDTGSSSYTLFKDEESIETLKKDYPEIYEKAKEKAIVYINNKLTELNFPKTYAEYATPDNPVYRQLGSKIPTYKKLEESVERYYLAINDRHGKTTKEYRQELATKVKEVKELLAFRKKLTKEQDNTSAPAINPANVSPTPESTTGHKPVTRQDPTAPAVISGDAGLTPTKNTKSKKKQNKTTNTAPTSFAEAVNKLKQQQTNTPANNTQQPVTPTTEEQPAEVFDPEDGTTLNYGAGKYFLLYQLNPEEFKNLSKDDKEKAIEEITNNLDSISFEQLFDFLKDTKKQFKAGTPLYNNIIRHIVENDSITGGMNSARLLDKGFAIEDDDVKTLAVQQAEQWLESNPREQTRFGKLMKYLKDVFLGKDKDNKDKQTVTTTTEPLKDQSNEKNIRFDRLNLLKPRVSKEKLDEIHDYMKSHSQPVPQTDQTTEEPAAAVQPNDSTTNNIPQNTQQDTLQDDLPTQIQNAITNDQSIKEEDKQKTLDNALYTLNYIKDRRKSAYTALVEKFNEDTNAGWEYFKQLGTQFKQEARRAGYSNNVVEQAVAFLDKHGLIENNENSIKNVINFVKTFNNTYPDDLTAYVSTNKKYSGNSWDIQDKATPEEKNIIDTFEKKWVEYNKANTVVPPQKQKTDPQQPIQQPNKAQLLQDRKALEQQIISRLEEANVNKALIQTLKQHISGVTTAELTNIRNSFYQHPETMEQVVTDLNHKLFAKQKKLLDTKLARQKQQGQQNKQAPQANQPKQQELFNTPIDNKKSSRETMLFIKANLSKK